MDASEQEVLDWLSREPTEITAAETERCRTDVGYWLNKYGLTYDPRLSTPVIRFHLYPKQFELLSWLRAREDTQTDGLVEKSRDQGVTFLCGGYALHGWLFRAGFAAGFGSRKLELVDRLGDMDSIFEKIRFLLYHLPQDMMPKGFKREEHDNFARLINPENGASITGEGGDQIGRGGRKSFYVVDEAAFLEHPRRVDGALLANTEVRIDVSTPNGPGNPFCEKRFSGKVAVFTMHYRDDPRKTAEWVEKKKASTDPVTWAQEYEIDYTASIEGICCPAAWVRAAVEFPLESRGPIIAGFDVAAEGSNLSAIVQRRGPVVTSCKTRQGLLPIQGAYWSIDEAELTGITEVRYDCVGVGEGVKSAYKATERLIPFEAVAWNGGDSPTEKIIYADGRTGKEKFANMRAEAWWSVRERFRKVYERVTLGTVYPDDECISLPNDAQLIAELSMPLVQTTDTGKIKIESKKDMAKRGIKSPDRADALVMGFSPVERKREVWFA